jgi:hypothetical protein
MPGLPWPQASADYNSWGVSIGVNNAQPAVGHSVTLTAQATANAVDNSGNLLSQFQIDIKDSSGNVVGTCKASPCTTQVSQAAAGSQTYTAQIDYPEPFLIPTTVTMAPPNPGDPLPSTTVTWHAPSWSVAPPPPVGAIKMAAVNSTDIWTVDGGTINHWNGASWDTPVSVSGVLNGITALSSTDIWAVGYQAVGTSGLLQTLIMHYDGVNWTPVPSPNVGDRNNMLNAVIGEFSSTIWAAGNYIDDTGTSQPLIESWNGSGWCVATIPSPVNVGSAFTAIDMDLPNDIWAVGVGNTSPTTVQAPFVEHYDGTRWQIIPAPTVDPAHPWEFTGVTALAPNNVLSARYCACQALVDHGPSGCRSNPLLRRCHQLRLRSAISVCSPLQLWGCSASRLDGCATKAGKAVLNDLLHLYSRSTPYLIAADAASYPEGDDV